MKKVIDWSETKKNIKNIMSEKDMTISQLAASTGRTASAVRRWFGPQCLSTGTVVLIAGALDISPETFITLTPEFKAYSARFKANLS